MLLPRMLCLACLLLIGCPNGSADDAGHRAESGFSDGAISFDAMVLGDITLFPWDRGPGCGQIPVAGQCTDAGVLRICYDNTPQEISCADLDFGCGSLPGSGFWCLAGAQQSCRDWPCRPPLVCGVGLTCRNAAAQDAAFTDG